MAAGRPVSDFSLADCAAAPSLFYGNMVVPFGDAHKNLKAYFERLKVRPSFARVLKEAEPYFQHGAEGALKGCANAASVLTDEDWICGAGNYP